MKTLNKHFEIIAFISSFIGCILAVGGNEYFLWFIIPGIVYIVKTDIKESQSESETKNN